MQTVARKGELFIDEVDPSKVKSPSKPSIKRVEEAPKQEKKEPAKKVWNSTFLLIHRVN